MSKEQNQKLIEEVEKIRDDCKLSGYEDNYYYKTLVKVLEQIEKEC